MLANTDGYEFYDNFRALFLLNILVNKLSIKGDWLCQEILGYFL